MTRRVTVESSPVEWPAIAVHGGAGSYERLADQPGLTARVEDGVDAALDAGWAVLAAGGGAVDAVVAAVRAFEENGAFNAGRGSVPTSTGTHEMDASVMDDRGRAGAVACLTGWSAVGAAHAVWRRSAKDGVLLLAGPGADHFAAGHDVPRLGPVSHDGTADPSPLSEQGTVGAVAVTASGRFAAATSTGGRPGQPPGRVGDTPIPGAGVWAQPGCAVSATGAGEAFILAGFSRLVGSRHSQGSDLPAALRWGLDEVARYRGNGGAVALGSDRTWAAAYDTRAMARGVRHAAGRRRAVTG
ncbi:MAG TPA: isoaspartyl peptidase/L-asparaginase [Acidimicrobiales bacterium]|nr:isoaspartyl peptidase/L-asparaginase [Acidimicrobiales bacterium]